MPKEVFQFPCPCCGKQVEVDTRSGKARAVKPEEAKGVGSLDDLLASHRKEQDRLGGTFEAAKGAQKRANESLEDALRRAKEEAKKDPKDKPRNPFDLD